MKLSSGQPLIVESLETTLKSVTFDAKNLKLWPKIPRCTCPSYPWNPIDKDPHEKLIALLHKLLHQSPYV